MPCDAIATARAKMPIVLHGAVILKLLQTEFPDLTLRSSEFNDIAYIYSTQGRSLRVNYHTQTGAYEVYAADDALTQSVITILQRAAAFVATRAFAKHGQILKAQRVNNATILKLQI